ncbi:hypothetical protein C0J50_16746 [Silurus asotus]|uniref:Uncharacterized protein n=1 Tax=Silurus asotus TaxID=30991 RepID=A0AAD5FNM7_SILAS|nr:hypothetical protein C0J50_16746 [Silurus asotus]
MSWGTELWDAIGFVKGLICERRSRVIWYRLQELSEDDDEEEEEVEEEEKMTGELQCPTGSHDQSDDRSTCCL